jgi:hypothetical protein
MSDANTNLLNTDTKDDADNDNNNKNKNADNVSNEEASKMAAKLKQKIDSDKQYNENVIYHAGRDYVKMMMPSCCRLCFCVIE